MSNAESIYAVLERISTLFRNDMRLAGLEHGLHPVHIEVLSYLSRCNKFSDTSAGVTEFLGITKGTASQSINLLHSKGLIEKTPDATDKRVTHLSLTGEGRNLASLTIPPGLIKSSLQNLSQEDGSALKTQLQSLLRDMQRLGNNASFGVCKTCVYHKTKSAGMFHCQLTGEDLTLNYGELICREHKQE